MPFWDRSLDGVVNTHPEADHLTGLPEVLRRYQVSQIILSDANSDTSLYAAWGETLAAEGAAVVVPAQAGARLSLGDGVWAEVLARYAGPGIPVLRTDELGSIEFITDGERLWVQAGRNRP